MSSAIAPHSGENQRHWAWLGASRGAVGAGNGCSAFLPAVIGALCQPHPLRRFTAYLGKHWGSPVSITPDPEGFSSNTNQICWQVLEGEKPACAQAENRGQFPAGTSLGLNRIPPCRVMQQGQELLALWVEHWRCLEIISYHFWLFRSLSIFSKRNLSKKGSSGRGIRGRQSASGRSFGSLVQLLKQHDGECLF